MRKSDFIAEPRGGKLSKSNLKPEQRDELLIILKERFDKNMDRHMNLNWYQILIRLENSSEKIWSLNEMEKTGGEPDVVDYDNETGKYIFYDCSEESPKGRRSLCYDRDALESRKNHPPKNTVIDMAASMNIQVLNEEQYRKLQKLGSFDLKTSSWLQTPSKIRDLGGAIFADYRFETIFIYHNVAESYYAARGFRGMVSI